MYNTSTALIGIRVEKNGQVLRSISVPYDLMSTVEDMYRLDGRTTVATILTQEFSTPPHSNAVALNPTDGPHPVLTINETIQNFKQLADSAAQFSLEFQIQSNYSGDFEVDEEMRSRIRATDILYAESLMAQQLLTEQRLSELNNQAQQEDFERQAAVTSIAVDPTRCVEFLLLPVGRTGDVQRQMAASVSNNVDYCTQIIESTSSLWITSYSLMQEFSLLAANNKDFAQLLHDKLPDDSVTKLNLVRLGLAS